MFVLEAKGENYNKMKFEVPTANSVGKMLNILFQLGVGIEEVVVSMREEIPIEVEEDV